MIGKPISFSRCFAPTAHALSVWCPSEEVRVTSGSARSALVCLVVMILTLALLVMIYVLPLVVNILNTKIVCTSGMASGPSNSELEIDRKVCRDIFI